jgi:hypothetical protein
LVRDFSPWASHDSFSSSSSRRTISFRRIKAINHEDLSVDLNKLLFFLDPADDINSFLTQYNSGLRASLDRHAPVSRRTFAIHPTTHGPAQLLQPREETSDVWRRRKRTGLMVDKLILCDGAQELRNAIDAARATSLNTQITKNSDRMFL